MIELKSISKQYKIAIKEKGLKGSIKSFFKRKYKIVDALKDVSFQINDGERLGLEKAGSNTGERVLIRGGKLSNSERILIAKRYAGHKYGGR